MSVKEDDLFEVDFGETGVTKMMESGVTQPDNSTIDDKPHLQEPPKKDTEDGFELVEKILDNDGEDDTTPEDDVKEVEVKGKTKSNPPSAKETKTTNKGESTNASESFAFVFAKYQQEEGNLSFDLDEKELQDIIEKNGEAGAMAYLWNKESEFRESRLKDMYEDDVKEFIELKDSGVDPERAKELMHSKIQFSTITPEQLEGEGEGAEELRRKVLKQDLINRTDLSEDEVDDQVESIILSGKDTDKAKKALGMINKFNNEQIALEKKAQADAEKVQAEQAKATRESMVKKINESKEIIPGYPISKQGLKNIEKMILEPAVKTKDGRVLNGVWAKFNENPEQSLIKLAAIMDSGIWDGKIDKLQKVAETKTAQKLEGLIKTKGSTLSNKGKSTASATDDDSLSSMKGVFPV